MDTPRPAFGQASPPFRRLVRTAALLTLALAGAAMAAPCARDDCRNASRELAGPQVALGALTVRIVDLAAPDVAEDAVGLSGSMAPLLYLTPRVTSILEEVFDDSVPAAGDPAAEAAPEAPLAEAEAGEEPDGYGTLSRADNAFQLPKFQRQMYRTDI